MSICQIIYQIGVWIENVASVVDMILIKMLLITDPVIKL